MVLELGQMHGAKIESGWVKTRTAKMFGEIIDALSV
jgi:hypothetical protein